MESLPFLPGLTFRDASKTRFTFPQTLVYSKGTQVSKPFTVGSAKEAVEFLRTQNKELDHTKFVELTYGRKTEPKREAFIPRYIALDKKVLRFHGFFREEINDWGNESYRIRPVKVLYYLQNDTMEVIEPKTENSGLFQGTLFKRHAFPHPNGKGRRYMWKDLNIGQDIFVYGIKIRLTDCDQWSREYLINAGIELDEPEQIPPDPHTEQRKAMEPRQEMEDKTPDNKKLFKFLECDRKVLRFYGTWQDILSDPPEMRRIVIQYYLADDTMEVLEDHERNCGRDPVKVLIKRQKIPVDRNELPESFPLSYMEVKDEDLRWFEPRDFRTGQDVIVLGKKIFLYDCDTFTRHYYKRYLGVDDMESISVAEKPKPLPSRIIPPHTGIGNWDDSLQNCLNIIPKTLKKDFQKELYFDGITLRFKARLISPIADEKIRRFVFTILPSDDSVTISEDFIPNSGFGGGLFSKRTRLRKKPLHPAERPVYYQVSDFYVGAKIRASGKFFELIDADPFVLKFMEEHPELYSEGVVKTHRENMQQSENDPDLILKREADLIEKLRQHVIENYGENPYPLPKALDFGNDLPSEEIVKEELYCANLPIPQLLINMVIEACTDKNKKTNMEKMRKILIPALGHRHSILS